MPPKVQAFFDKATSTVTYVVYRTGHPECAIIDPVLDYDHAAGRTSSTGADRVIEYVRSHGLDVQWILETHAHADHLTAAPYLRQQQGGQVAIGRNISRVQAIFKKLFNLEHEFQPDGSQFDHLFDDNETFDIGGMNARALYVPGHTPADMAYQIGDAVFVGDTLFMPDVGTARCDFPGGNAHELYRSICRLLSLPDDTRLFMCHDYPPPGREPCWQTSVHAERTGNIHVHDGISEEQFVSMREARDSGLGMPALILPAVQVNIRAGEFPPAGPDGVHYLKIPLNMI